MRHDHPDPDQPPARERATCDSARVGVEHERLAPRVDGVFAVPVRIPGGRAPTPLPRNELGAMLLEEDVDALGAVDLADARQLAARSDPGSRRAPPPRKLATRRERSCVICSAEKGRRYNENSCVSTDLALNSWEILVQGFSRTNAHIIEA